MKNNPIAKFMHINVSICKFEFQMSGLNKVHIQRTYWIKTKEFFRYGVVLNLGIHIYKSNRNKSDVSSKIS